MRKCHIIKVEANKKNMNDLEKINECVPLAISLLHDVLQ